MTVGRSLHTDQLTQYEHDAVGNLASTTYGDGTRELRFLIR
jgi:hypothetical protein